MAIRNIMASQMNEGPPGESSRSTIYGYRSASGVIYSGSLVSWSPGDSRLEFLFGQGIHSPGLQKRHVLQQINHYTNDTGCNALCYSKAWYCAL